MGWRGEATKGKVLREYTNRDSRAVKASFLFEDGFYKIIGAPMVMIVPYLE